MEMRIESSDETLQKDLDGLDDEDKKLISSHRQYGHHGNPHQDCNYGIDTNISYGRPDFQDILPRLLLGGGRICVVGCGRQEMNIDLSSAVAVCQTAVLRGGVREVRLWTETFGW